MNFKSASEIQAERTQLASVFEAAINKWMSLGTRLAVSSTDPEKLKLLKDRLEMFSRELRQGSFDGIADALVSERIVDHCHELKDIDNRQLKKLFNAESLAATADGLHTYITNRMGRLSQFFDKTEQTYKLKSEHDVMKLFDEIQGYIQFCDDRTVCACLANEAACIGRNLRKMKLQYAQRLDDQCHQIVRASVLKSRNL